MDNCSHKNKVFADYVLASDPPGKPWICPDCLTSGVHRDYPQTSMLDESYEDIMKRKKEVENA